MTDLNKLLYVASKLYHYVELRGNEVWVGDEIKEPEIIGGPEVKSETFDLFVFEPHKPTERGKAQLMDIEDAILKTGVLTLNNYNGKFMASYTPHININGLHKFGKTNKEAIINLAAEVL